MSCGSMDSETGVFVNSDGPDPGPRFVRYCYDYKRLCGVQILGLLFHDTFFLSYISTEIGLGLDPVEMVPT